LQELENLLIFRKLTALLLGEERFAVRNDLENTAVATNQLGLDTELLSQGGRQTGGPWQVVSMPAIFDRYLHTRPAPPYACLAAVARQD